MQHFIYTTPWPIQLLILGLLLSLSAWAVLTGMLVRMSESKAVSWRRGLTFVTLFTVIMADAYILKTATWDTSVHAADVASIRFER